MRHTSSERMLIITTNVSGFLIYLSMRTIFALPYVTRIRITRVAAPNCCWAWCRPSIHEYGISKRNLFFRLPIPYLIVSLQMNGFVPWRATCWDISIANAGNLAMLRMPARVFRLLLMRPYLSSPPKSVTFPRPSDYSLYRLPFAHVVARCVPIARAECDS